VAESPIRKRYTQAFKMNKDTSMIRSRNLNPTLAAVGALVLSLIIAYGTDRIWSLIVEEAQKTFVVLPGLWVRAAIPLIQAAVMLVLAWALLIRLPPNRIAAIIFLASGCLIIGTYLTIFTGFPVGLRTPIIGPFRQAIMALGATSNLYHMAAFWIFVGIAGLMRRSLKTESTPDEKQRKTTE
jgi:hypothetical protein